MSISVNIWVSMRVRLKVIVAVLFLWWMTCREQLVQELKERENSRPRVGVRVLLLVLFIG